MNSGFISPNFLLIECIINPSNNQATTKSAFGNQKELQNKKVVGVEYYTFDDVYTSPISTGNSPAAPFISPFLFLTLYRAQTKDTSEGLYYDLLPACRLRCVTLPFLAGSQVGISNAYDIFRMEPAEISWTKSYVTSAYPFNMTAPISTLWGVHYLNENQDWRPYSMH